MAHKRSLGYIVGHVFFAVGLAAVAAGCEVVASQPYAVTVEALPAVPGPSVGDDFGNYWYQGKAEITTYDLEQARYGEIHGGTAVLIYVTEPFSEKTQVKVDDPATESVTVLKLNATRNFNTGIYPYSMMTSVFTPVNRPDGDRTIKVTTSSQEWCGHTFTQMNRTRAGYRLKLFSYFESEGDQDVVVKGALLEDELWTWLRIDPSTLPLGDVRLIPGGIYQRLSHAQWQAQDARTSLATDRDDSGVSVYTVSYPDANRKLEIRFSTSFPYEVQGWEETRQSGFGPAATTLTTRATVNKSLMIDYWTRNGVDDLYLREQLGLPL